MSLLVLTTAPNEETQQPFSRFGWAMFRKLSDIAELGHPKILTLFSRRPATNRAEDYFHKAPSAESAFGAWTKGLVLRPEFEEEAVRVVETILTLRPNLVLTLDNLPMWIMSGQTSIKAQRGTVNPGRTFRGQALPKTLGTWGMATLVKQFSLFPVMMQDFDKAKRHSSAPDFSRPSRFIHMEPESVDELWEFYENHIRHSDLVACDIETKALTITEVGFAPSPSRALVIPFLRRPNSNYWPTAKEEEKAWEFIRYVLTHHQITGQNYQYDLQYFFSLMGIPSPNYTHDTMIMHHALEPEMEKSLGFLGSVYTDEPPWKNTRQKHETLKKED